MLEKVPGFIGTNRQVRPSCIKKWQTKEQELAAQIEQLSTQLTTLQEQQAALRSKMAAAMGHNVMLRAGQTSNEWITQSVDEMGHFTIPGVMRTLRELGINTLADLCTKTAEDILEIPGFGEKTLSEIRGKLDFRGLRLKNDQKENVHQDVDKIPI
jgi:DNA-directed RNA polymerase alpha subunit